MILPPDLHSHTLARLTTAHTAWSLRPHLFTILHTLCSHASIDPLLPLSPLRRFPLPSVRRAFVLVASSPYYFYSSPICATALGSPTTSPPPPGPGGLSPRASK